MGISSGQSAARDKRGKKVAIVLKHICAEVVDTASQRVIVFPPCTFVSLAKLPHLVERFVLGERISLHVSKTLGARRTADVNL